MREIVFSFHFVVEKKKVKRCEANSAMSEQSESGQGAAWQQAELGHHERQLAATAMAASNANGLS